MNYIVAIIIPPLALIFSGAIFHAIFNAIILALSLFILIGTLGFGAPIAWGLWVFSIIHAVFIIHGRRTDKAIERKVSEMMSKDSE